MQSNLKIEFFLAPSLCFPISVLQKMKETYAVKTIKHNIETGFCFEGSHRKQQLVIKTG